LPFKCNLHRYNWVKLHEYMKQDEVGLCTLNQVDP
jgi:hypothetical protein